MPTPFSHMVALAQLLTDEAVPATIRATLNEQRPAYILGTVAPDARPDVPDPREATHFYSYTRPMEKHPWLLMLDRHPSLVAPKDAAHLAFLAGYVAHLAMDEIWTKHMLKPHFAESNWGEDIHHRFFNLHLMLIDMDERDLLAIPTWAPAAIQQAQPDDWLPFLPQSILTDWQTLIHQQIQPEGSSQTLAIFGARVGRTAQDLRQLADDEQWMQREIWDHVPRSVLTDVEVAMYNHARHSLMRYVQEYAQLSA